MQDWQDKTLKSQVTHHPRKEDFQQAAKLKKILSNENSSINNVI